MAPQPAVPRGSASTHCIAGRHRHAGVVTSPAALTASRGGRRQGGTGAKKGATYRKSYRASTFLIVPRLLPPKLFPRMAPGRGETRAGAFSSPPQSGPASRRSEAGLRPGRVWSRHLPALSLCGQKVFPGSPDQLSVAGDTFCPLNKTLQLPKSKQPVPCGCGVCS